MKPIESRAMVAEVVEFLAAGEPLSPRLMAHFVGALRERLNNPTASLDRLLGLRSTRGGRLHAFSKMPERDAALRALAGEAGPILERAARLLERIRRHRCTPDPELAHIEATCGRLPNSQSQLQRILAGRTVASQMAKGAYAKRVAPDNIKPSSTNP